MGAEVAGMAAVDTLVRYLLQPKPPAAPDILGMSGMQAPGQQPPGQQPSPETGGGGALASPFAPGLDIFGNPLQGAPPATAPDPETSEGRGAFLASIAHLPLDEQKRLWDDFRDPTPIFEIPTMSELDVLGKAAVTGQFESEVEQFEEGKDILAEQRQTVGDLKTEKAEGVEAGRKERAEQLQAFEDGLIELDALPDDVRKEVYGNVDNLKSYIEGRIGTTLKEMRTEYAGMRDVLESMNESHFAEARDRTAEMLQATGSGVMAEVGNTVRTMQSDPRFQEMSADQQGVALQTVRLTGAAQIGSTLATVGAQERARLDTERLSRDQIMSSFDEVYLTQSAGTRRVLESTGISEVGAAQREAGQAVANAMFVRAEQKRIVRSDMANFRNQSRLAEQNFILGQNQLILQGNRDAFTMNSSLQRPVLESGLMNHALAMQTLGIGIYQLDYSNRVQAFALETGYIGSLLAPFEGVLGYQMQKGIADAGKADDPGFDWGGLIPSIGINVGK